MNIIFYWKKSYFKNEYQKVLSNYKLYTDYPPKGIASGDTMWIVTKNEDGYVLVSKLIIEKTQREPSVHGDFSIVGDQSASVFYKLDNANNKAFLSAINNLTQWPNDEFGKYFQGERHIQELYNIAHQEFEKFSKTLQTI